MFSSAASFFFLVDITHLNLDEGWERVVKYKISKQKTAKAYAKVRTTITKICNTDTTISNPNCSSLPNDQSNLFKILHTHHVVLEDIHIFHVSNV